MEQILNPLHLACRADDFSPNQRLIEIKNGIATATNGHIIARIDLRENGQLAPEQIELLNGKFIDMEVWKECHKCEQVEITDENIICYKNGIKKTFDFSSSQGQFFNTDSIIIGISKAGEEEKRIMKFSAKYIGIFEKIFGSSEITFSFSKGEQGTLVFPNDHGGMFGVLMPVRTDGTENRYYFLT